MDFFEEFFNKFGDKYKNLQLKNVVVKKSGGTCTITFLYPSTDKELEESEKREIIDWLQESLQLEKIDLKVKFMRVFVEEKLILKAIKTFFESRYKLISTYFTDESYSVSLTGIDVVVKFVLSERMQNFFSEHKIIAELSKYLKDNFLTEFSIEIEVDNSLVDDVDIENVEIKATYKPVQRYTVEILKEFVGTGIMPHPEYLSFIKSPKAGVVVAGYLKKIERRDFIRKTGQHAGEPKAYYNFQIEDERGKMDCIYFCPKSKEKDLDALEEAMFLLLHGDVEMSKYTGKLVLKVDKMAWATKAEVEEVFESQKIEKKYEGQVVEIEKLTSLAQDNMFSEPVKYNDTINGKTFVVFDIETTGLDTAKDQITEIGAVKIVDGQISEKFASFIHPTIPIPFEVTQLTGITDAMVADAPPAEAVLRDFHNFTRGAVLCGHNIIGFDLKIVKRMGNEYGYFFDNEVLDTLNLARQSHLRTTNFKLGTIVKYLGLTLEGAHRAWNDAFATAQVLLKLCEVK